MMHRVDFLLYEKAILYFFFHLRFGMNCFRMVTVEFSIDFLNIASDRDPLEKITAGGEISSFTVRFSIITFLLIF